ncbi:hypothetical protein Psch_01678 [Pelotomaculum schinkii]|uniref:Uncharacterized protein n=1 Tax=Pelotomaculum schinkii TaxID=78350 RepID=A0A4Y7RH61_9FIRM|nr:hypothetical protein Psch_01678 [Pelotomaculum schinkii]
MWDVGGKQGDGSFASKFGSKRTVPLLPKSSLSSDILETGESNDVKYVYQFVTPQCAFSLVVCD